MFWFNTGVQLEIKGGVGYWRHRRFYKYNRKYLMWWNNGRMTFLYPGYRNRNRQTIRFVKAGNYYNIMATNCVYRSNYAPDNTYLSVNSAGTRVDIYAYDDGSGRQRWHVKGPIAGGGYNIIIAGGVRGKRKYLSTNWRGNRVDLWIKDDNTGRQRWKITGQLMPTPKPTPKPTPRPTPVPVKNLLSGGGWKIVKGKRKCTISIENGVKHPCAVSPNYPKPYSAEVKCEVSMKNTKYVYLKGSSEKYFDYLTISGKQYSGRLSGKKLAAKGTFKWTADFFEATRGWKVCKGKKPRMRLTPKKKFKVAFKLQKPGVWKCPGGYKRVYNWKLCKAANFWWRKTTGKFKDKFGPKLGIGGLQKTKHLVKGCYKTGNPYQMSFYNHKGGKMGKVWGIPKWQLVCYKKIR